MRLVTIKGTPQQEAWGQQMIQGLLQQEPGGQIGAQEAYPAAAQYGQAPQAPQAQAAEAAQHALAWQQYHAAQAAAAAAQQQQQQQQAPTRQPWP